MEKPMRGLSDRKRMLLKAIIEVHIRRGEPVGSKFLIQDKQISLSSATIRNEMAELEQMGYLEQPHTSAGRIPSKRGYRFYVDALLDRYVLTPAEGEELGRLHAAKQEETDRILNDAAKMLSRMTNYTSVAVRLRAPEIVVKRFDTLLHDPYHFLLIMTCASGEIKTKSLRLTFPIDTRVLQRLTALLNETIAGIEVSEITMQQVLFMEREMGVYNIMVNPIIKCVFGTMREEGEGDIRFEGVNRLLQYPEFFDADRIRQLFDLIDSKEEILEIIENSDCRRTNIEIGSDTGVDVIDNSTLIFRTVQRHGRPIGAVGVIGPCRMDYERVVTLVDKTARTVSDMLADNGARLGLPGSTQRDT